MADNLLESPTVTPTYVKQTPTIINLCEFAAATGKQSISILYTIKKKRNISVKKLHLANNYLSKLENNTQVGN